MSQPVRTKSDWDPALQELYICGGGGSQLLNSPLHGDLIIIVKYAGDEEQI